jgi:hypothetical protein
MGILSYSKSLEEVANLESIAYNQCKQAIVKRTQKRKRVDVDNVIICTTEESLLDIKKAKLNDLLSVRIVISHATIEKVKAGEDEVENIRKQIATLKNQVEYYKGAQECSE